MITTAELARFATEHSAEYLAGISLKEIESEILRTECIGTQKIVKASVLDKEKDIVIKTLTDAGYSVEAKEIDLGYLRVLGPLFPVEQTHGAVQLTIKW